MNPERRRRIEELFDQLLDEPRANWESVLEGACGGDEELRSEVQKLLHAHERSEGILEDTSFLGRPFLPEGESIPAGRRVGKYRVLWEVGRGGMGIVYRAERADGHFHRTVALKLGTRIDPTFRISCCRIVNVTADTASHLLHCVSPILWIQTDHTNCFSKHPVLFRTPLNVSR